MRSNVSGGSDCFGGWNRCRVTPKKNSDLRRNPAIGSGLPCARHIRGGETVSVFQVESTPKLSSLLA